MNHNKYITLAAVMSYIYKKDNRLAAINYNVHLQPLNRNSCLHYNGVHRLIIPQKELTLNKMIEEAAKVLIIFFWSV